MSFYTCFFKDVSMFIFFDFYLFKANANVFDISPQGLAGWILPEESKGILSPRSPSR